MLQRRTGRSTVLHIDGGNRSFGVGSSYLCYVKWRQGRLSILDRFMEVGEAESELKMRIQPRDIEVPQDHPFENDLLGRKKSIEVLTNIVRSIDGPCTLAVDAPWGAGKTTFIRIWAQVLRNQDFPVVSFNAWETDFSNDPFVALSEEVARGLQAYSDDSLRYKIDNLRKRASEVAIRAVPGAVRLATAGVLDLNPLFEKETGNILASYAKDRLAAHVEAQESLQSFRTTLQDTANTLAQNNNGLPLVIVIDELDRCRPSYAVELLEVAKHLFSVDHIVFVLAVNRSELAHSVCALYGNSFDGPDYLKRFFDLDFRLPNPSRREFIRAALGASQIEEYFDRTRDQNARNEYGPILDLLIHFLGAHSLSIRTVAQAIRRLGLVLASLRSDKRMVGLATAVTMIIRTVDLDLYHRFIRGEASDKEVVDTIFRMTENEHLRETQSYSRSGPLFEALVIQGCREMSKLHDGMNIQMESPLQEHYIKYRSGREENGENDNGYKYAGRVLSLADNQDLSGLSWGITSFEYAIERVELLSEELLGDDV